MLIGQSCSPLRIPYPKQGLNLAYGRSAQITLLAAAPQVRPIQPPRR